ncbi:hypothetical protein KV097_16540 [Mumia sp. zg.B17]|uniref:hypothetical protein n=1 Tax=Mumia sp. zg.B17 TaxID=2855446 RepID=UPI001C6EC647|nr:hypothetical protein [Mumia sp. zg.B17]MBW9207548.1 hypothetical protein [Mumia sp. zg.B17]
MIGISARRRRWSGKRALGVGLALLGIAVPIYLAYSGSTDKPPSASVQALLAFISVVSQLGAALAFSRVGVVDPSHLRGAIRRLELLRQRSASARQIADALVDQPKIELGDRRAVFGELSVFTSVIQEEIVEAMGDWYAAMPHVADQVAGELEQGITKEDEDT